MIVVEGRVDELMKKRGRNKKVMMRPRIKSRYASFFSFFIYVFVVSNGMMSVRMKNNYSELCIQGRHFLISHICVRRYGWYFSKINCMIMVMISIFLVYVQISEVYDRRQPSQEH